MLTSPGEGGRSHQTVKHSFLLLQLAPEHPLQVLGDSSPSSLGTYPQPFILQKNISSFVTRQPQSIDTSTAHLVPRLGAEALNGTGHFVQGNWALITGQVQKVHHKVESRKSLKEKEYFNLTGLQHEQDGGNPTK